MTPTLGVTTPLLAMTAAAGEVRTPQPITRPSQRREPRAVLTTSYLLVLLATTLTLRTSPVGTAAALLQASSTDVWHLTHHRFEVLVTSALWLPNERWWYYAAVFIAFMAPLERRVGAPRMFLVFLSGHILATLLTELPLAAATWLGWLPLTALHRLDVGVSYGMFTVVAAYAGLLPTRTRQLVMAGASALVTVPLLATHDMTSVGHALSLLIGVLWWRPLRRCSIRDPRLLPSKLGLVARAAMASSYLFF